MALTHNDSISPLTSSVPVLMLHDVVGTTQRRQLPVQVVPESTGLVASVDLPGQPLLPGNEAKQPVERHFLDRLRSGPVNLACHVKPLGMGIDTQLDRRLQFGRISLFFSVHGSSGSRFRLRLTNPCHLSPWQPIIGGPVDVSRFGKRQAKVNDQSFKKPGYAEMLFLRRGER